MLWLRGLIFTALVPVVIGFVVPASLAPGATVRFVIGWLPVAIGALIYASCLIRFLAAGGTPAIFFTRPLRHLIGEEPTGLVASGLYRYSRNPMYVGVTTAILGQAVLFADGRIAVYGGFVFLCFHLVVVLVEEPHLRATRGEEYERYCRRVSRWIGLPG